MIYESYHMRIFTLWDMWCSKVDIYRENDVDMLMRSDVGDGEICGIYVNILR